MRSVKINVEGMRCGACKILVEDALYNLGVVNVKFEKNIANVEFEEKEITLHQIKKRILDEGYNIGKLIGEHQAVNTIENFDRKKVGK